MLELHAFCPMSDTLAACSTYYPCMANGCRQRLVHFVGFRGEEYWSAVGVFGLPDFVHYVWDQRAQRELTPTDVVVFAKYDPTDPPSPYNHDDSNFGDDPAATCSKKKIVTVNLLLW